MIAFANYINNEINDCITNCGMNNEKDIYNAINIHFTNIKHDIYELERIFMRKLIQAVLSAKEDIKEMEDVCVLTVGIYYNNETKIVTCGEDYANKDESANKKLLFTVKR